MRGGHSVNSHPRKANICKGTDWLRRVSAAIPSSRPANSLSALNAFAELLEGKGGLCLEGKVDVKSLSNHLFGMAQHGEENTVATPLALRTLNLLSTMCCDCTIKVSSESRTFLRMSETYSPSVYRRQAFNQSDAFLSRLTVSAAPR